MTINYKELLKALWFSFKEAFKWKIWKWFIKVSHLYDAL